MISNFCRPSLVLQCRRHKRGCCCEGVMAFTMSHRYTVVLCDGWSNSSKLEKWEWRGRLQTPRVGVIVYDHESSSGLTTNHHERPTPDSIPFDSIWTSSFTYRVAREFRWTHNHVHTMYDTTVTRTTYVQKQARVEAPYCMHLGMNDVWCIIDR